MSSCLILCILLFIIAKEVRDGGYSDVCVSVSQFVMTVHCLLLAIFVLFGRQYTVISCLFREQLKLLTRDAGDDLRTVA